MAGKSNMELLTPDENRIEPFLKKWYNPGMASILSVITVLAIRYGQRRPVFSGIQSHVFAGVVGGTVGYYVDKHRDKALAERDAILRYYLQTHPEDFPEPERKKYADILLPWVPVR